MSLGSRPMLCECFRPPVYSSPQVQPHRDFFKTSRWCGPAWPATYCSYSSCPAWRSPSLWYVCPTDQQDQGLSPLCGPTVFWQFCLQHLPVPVLVSALLDLLGTGRAQLLDLRLTVTPASLQASKRIRREAPSLAAVDHLLLVSLRNCRYSLLTDQQHAASLPQRPPDWLHCGLRALPLVRPRRTPDCQCLALCLLRCW